MALIKKVIQVELLYDDDISPNPESLGLDEIGREMTDGSMSGVMETISTKRLTKKQMAQALQKQGSDPEFLNVD